MKVDERKGRGRLHHRGIDQKGTSFDYQSEDGLKDGLKLPTCLVECHERTGYRS